MKHPEYSEEAFLQSLTKHHMEVAIYLVNGVKLTGQLEAIDKQCLLLRPCEEIWGVYQLIYKNAVATIQEEYRKAKALTDSACLSEDGFLQSLVNDLAYTTVFTLNKIKLEGQLVGFDGRSVFLRDGPGEGRLHMIYKSSISTIQNFSDAISKVRGQRQRPIQDSSEEDRTRRASET